MKHRAEAQGRDMDTDWIVTQDDAQTVAADAYCRIFAALDGTDAQNAVLDRAVALARREAAKIEKHRDIWQENAKREQEHLEDLELEEFATPSRASDDA